MATTNNLRLELLEGESVVDYNQLNGWMSTIDQLGVEFVTKKGTSGNFWYRIWSSGRAECGVDNRLFFNSLSLNNSSIWPPFHVNSGGRLSPFGGYPINFVSRPYANICFNYCDQTASCIVIQSSQAGSQTAPSFVLANNSYSTATLTNVQMSIFCVGNTK